MSIKVPFGDLGGLKTKCFLTS